MALGGSGRLNIGDQDTIQKVYRGTFIEGAKKIYVFWKNKKRGPKMHTKQRKTGRRDHRIQTYLGRIWKMRAQKS